MARKTTQWFLSFQLTIFLLLVFVRGHEDEEDAYKNGRHLVLEYFLPINLPAAVDVPLRREKRDVEGSGEDDSSFAELKESEDADNSTQHAVGKFILEDKTADGSASVEGSGEVDDGSEEDRSDATSAAIIGESEILPTTLSEESTKIPEVITEDSLTSTEMIFDKSEDFDALSTSRTEETTTAEVESTPVVMLINPEADKTTTESRENESTTAALQETTTVTEEATTAPTEAMTVPQDVTEAVKPSVTEATTQPPTTVPEETTTTGSPILIPVAVPEKVAQEDHETTQSTAEPKPFSSAPSTSVFLPSDIIPNATEGLPTVPKSIPIPTTPQPVVEEIFQDIKMDRKLEATPGKILQKENLSLGADPLLIANTRLMDSEENVQLSSAEPKRLGAYIVIALILLSFLTLVGYITFKKRMNRKRQEFESNQESNDTEKALLSLSDYKDSTELEENHLKNNEITPIVVKSNSQINRFEKNTNFSSPKNLNTTANEKNIEKDNVLKSTAENLTQVIIEDSPKDLEEDTKTASGMERLIVKTRIDQDSIPKKPILINRSSTGYIPIPQDNS